MLHQSQEEDLIEKSKANDFIAFKQLVEMYRPIVERFAYQLGNHFNDVEDITQEVFLRVYRFLNQYNQAKFSTWLYKITLNVTRDNRRKIGRMNRKIAKYQQEYHEEYSAIESHILQSEEDRRLHRCIQQLVEKYQTPIILYYFHDKKYEEIAEILEIKLSTVKTRLLRAKHILKDIHEKQERKEGNLYG